MLLVTSGGVVLWAFIILYFRVEALLGPMIKRPINGLVSIYKPRGWTSNDVVSEVKKVLREGESKKIKVGHGGTLDPMAEGVLVLGLGDGTKKLQDFLKGSKVYRTTAEFGASTDTLDATGSITRSKQCDFVSKALIESALPSFIGSILQTPPMYSALKVNGTRLYDLARKGIEVKRSPRKVLVHRISVSEEDLPHSVQFDIECDGGFYVRSFIDDLANSIDACAHMTKLIRLRHGPFTIENSIPIKELAFQRISDELLSPLFNRQNN